MTPRTHLALAVLVASSSALAVSAVATASPASKEAEPLRILLTNDDGWRGAGGATTPLIVAARDALEAAGHDVVVVAPGTDQSGQGGRISLPPITVELGNPEPDVWTVTPGSPADSVFFAFDEIFDGDLPDLVISGMNPGANDGAAVNHSGTVNAALTALEFGVPSIAVSLEPPATWRAGVVEGADEAAAYVVSLVAELQEGRQLMPEGVALNVNYPVLAGPVDPATGTPNSIVPPLGTRATEVAGARAFCSTTRRSAERPGPARTRSGSACRRPPPTAEPTWLP